MHTEMKGNAINPESILWMEVGSKNGRIKSQIIHVILFNSQSPSDAFMQVMHICVSKLVIIGSDNDLLPGQCQSIIWTNAWKLFYQTLGTNFSEILIEIHIFSFKKMHSKMSSGKWWQFCLKGITSVCVVDYCNYN